MKVIFVVALTALLVAFASTSPPECGSGNGQNALFLPNPEDCSTFYQCDRDEPLLMQCNEGLEFNPKLQVCDWPKKTVTCKRRLSMPPSQPDSPIPAPTTISASPDEEPMEVTV